MQAGGQEFESPYLHLIISQAALSRLTEKTAQTCLPASLTTGGRGYLKNIPDEHTEYANRKADTDYPP